MGAEKGEAEEEEEGTASCSVAYCPASSLFKLSAVGILMCKSTQSHVRGTSDPLSTLYRPPLPVLTLTGSTSHATLILITEADKQLLDTKISLALAGRITTTISGRGLEQFDHPAGFVVVLQMRLAPPLLSPCPCCTCSSRQLVVQFLCVVTGRFKQHKQSG